MTVILILSWLGRDMLAIQERLALHGTDYTCREECMGLRQRNRAPGLVAPSHPPLAALKRKISM